ncbi:MAG: aldehyde dehydrogenase family protein, partial [Chloroflexi bacterium]|nr:aldehyde dehydrogenase family protein [Chloroflexota bacterium]
MPDRFQNFINGAWVSSVTEKVIANINPADTSDVIGEFQASSSGDAASAITAASNARRGWAGTSSLTRGGYLLK